MVEVAALDGDGSVILFDELTRDPSADAVPMSALVVKEASKMRD